MAKIFLVTGGTGFLGSALVKKLLANGDEVRILDNNSRGSMRRLSGLESNVNVISGDCRSLDTMLKASQGVDCIVHMAAVNGTKFFYTHPELVLDVAVRGMLAVVDACKANDIGEIIVASSSETYQTPTHVPTPECVPLVVPDVLNPRYSYGGGKIISELIAMNYSRQNFDRVVIFRPHNVYGPDMGWEHVIPEFSVRAVKLIDQNHSGVVKFPIKGDGTQTRSFIYIDDFVDGLMRVMDKGSHQAIYNIGTEEEVSIAALASKVFSCLGKEINLQTSAAPTGETNRRCPDIAKLRALGFRQRVSLEEGLRETVGWYANNFNLIESAFKPQ